MSLPLIPDTAPFSSEQRAWLNGFFAGMLGVGQVSSLPGTERVPLLACPAVPVGNLGPEMAARGSNSAPPQDDHPWHDPALPLNERLQLAEGKPLASRLMAAMAQLDCGACGYVCQSYSAAIAAGEEKDLTRCSPGGSETAKTLKRLLAIAGPGARSQEPAASSQGVQSNGKLNGSLNGHAAVEKYTRDNPFTARIASVTRLTHQDAPKDTRHVSIDLLDSELTYEPGDALGVCPVNCPDLVRGVIQQLNATGDEPLSTAGRPTKPLREALATDVALSRCPTELLELLAASAQEPAEASRLCELAAADGGPLAGVDLCEMLERFPSARPALAELVAALPRLQPRLYSISSSLKRHPGQVHLTVGVVRFESAGRWRNGVASHFLGVRSNSGDPVRIFVHHSPRFRLPADSNTPIIMVGPGTGIAPFIAFLQEREATGAKGRNWLLFGNQYIHLDFLYREQLDQWAEGGLLNRLDVAFSRDTRQKLYVQHRMLENGAEFWSWLEAGASFYVCGDAKRMAPDVEAALVEIARDHGCLAPAQAKAYVARLAKDNRYLRDVY
ncbi:MAG: sulfite reductase subunit alpha [Planctomycetaceae bacterium]|nr:sulfite reductase subunit alpha [Planctomycetaceae bacterium]